MNISPARLYFFFALALPFTNGFAQSSKNFSPADYYSEGMRLHQQGDYADAVEYYNITITMDPGCSKCLYNRGLALGELEKYNKALADFNQLVEINPLDIEAYEQRGHLRFITGDSEGAVSDFSTVINSTPSAAAFTNRGMAYLNLEQYPNAIRDLEDGIRLDAHDDVAHRTLGDALFATNNISESIRLYTRALEINDRDIIALNNRGNAYQLQGQDELALMDYDQGIALLENSFTYTNRAKYWIKKENYEQALIDSRAATKLDFNNAEAYYCVGLIENVQRNHEIAAENFNKAIALDDDQAIYYNGRGLALFQLGEYKDALSDFESALILNPADAAAKDRISDCHQRLQRASGGDITVQMDETDETFTERGGGLVEYAILNSNKERELENTPDRMAQAPAEEIFYERTVTAFALVNTTSSISDMAQQSMAEGDEYLSSKWYEPAIQQYSAALLSDALLVEAYYKRAQCYMLINDLENAIIDLDKYLLLNPENADAYNDRGTLRFRTGNVFGAKEDYNNGIAIDFRHTALLSNRGRWYMHMGYFKEAIEDFTTALQNDQHQAPIYYQRGLAYFELKDYEQVDANMSNAIKESSIDRYEYYFLKGKSQLLSGRSIAALGSFDKTIALSPRFAEAYMYRAVTKQQLQDRDGACEDYTMAASLGYDAINEGGPSQYCQEEETARIDD